MNPLLTPWRHIVGPGVAGALGGGGGVAPPPCVVVGDAVATGGTITADVGTCEIVHTFDASGTFLLDDEGDLPVTYTITGTGSFDGDASSGAGTVTDTADVVVTSGTVEVRYDPNDFVADDYGALVASQGATNYWALQTALAESATEADQIGANELTMTSGAVALAGDGPWSGSDALAFVETDTEVLVSGSNPDLNADWSLSFWCKMLATAGTVPILAAVHGSGFYLFLIHRNDRGGLTLQMTSNGVTAVYSDFGTGRNIEADDTWHHIAVTREYSATAADDVLTTWLDGSLSSQRTRATVGFGAAFGAGPLTLGNRIAADIGINGRMTHAAFAQGVVWGSTEIAAQAGFTP